MARRGDSSSMANRADRELRRSLTASTHADTMRFAEFDLNNDCKLDFDEFYAAMPRRIREMCTKSHGSKGGEASHTICATTSQSLSQTGGLDRKGW